MRTYPGVVMALVVSTDDPEGRGRIQVQYPWLPDMREYPWAPLVVPLAGGGRGAWFMPEGGDEVLVAFEHGDFDHPVVLGFLWNGAQRPPAEGIDASVRRLRTVSGHVVDFVDSGGNEKILVKTQGGHEIEMKDKVPASVHVKTTGGQEIDLEDVPPSITLKTAGGVEIVITDTPPGVTISTADSSVSMSSSGMTLRTNGILNVAASLAIFSGVLQVPTLIAQAVVGSAYTPAPGNTFGL